MRKVFIIGTHHVYQYGGGAVFDGVTCSPEQEAKFRQLLTKACRSHSAVAIGEEMSEDALTRMKRTESIPRNEARALSLAHRYCDASEDERNKLGIRDDSYIRATGQWSGKSKALIEEDVLEEHKKREPYWLDQLSALDAWPVLFVCGSCHVPSFSALLRQSGAEETILEDDWRA